MMKRWSKLDFFLCAVMTLYISTVTALQSTWIASTCKNGNSVILFAISFFAAGVVSVFLFSYLCKKNICFECTARESTRGRLKWFILPFCLSVLISVIYLYAFYQTDVFVYDMKVQLNQAQSGRYSDWHPVLHTLLFYTLPLKLFGTRDVIVPLQCLYFSVAFGYMVYTLADLGAPVWLRIITIVFVLGNSNFFAMLMSPLKDNAFAIFAMLLVSAYARVVVTKGSWLFGKIYRFIAFCFVFAACSLMRHNAILYTLPLLLIIALFYLRKWWKKLLLIFCCMAIIFTVKVPYYNHLGVTNPGYRVLESTGMCMTMMGYAVVNSPEQVPEDVKEFLYAVAPREKWETYFNGTFNNLKWSCADWSVIENAGIGTILKYTFKTMAACPALCMEGFCRLTRLFWQTDYEYVSISVPSELSSPIEPDSLRYRLLYAVESWNDWLNSGITKYIFCYCGVWQLLMILFAVYKSRKVQNLEPFLHILPVMAYNFGTGLLLTHTGDWRFFYYSGVVLMPVVFLLLRKENGKVLPECGGLC